MYVLYVYLFVYLLASTTASYGDGSADIECIIIYISTYKYINGILTSPYNFSTIHAVVLKTYRSDDMMMA